MASSQTTSNKSLTAVKRQRRAQWEQLVLSLGKPQHTSIKSDESVKAKPGVGAFATS